MFTNVRERLFFYLGGFLMPAKKSQNEDKVNVKSNSALSQDLKKIEKDRVKEMSKLQSEICRNILETADVTKSQVNGDIVQGLTNTEASKGEVKNVIKSVNARIDVQTNQLIDRVLKAFTPKKK